MRGVSAEGLARAEERLTTLAEDGNALELGQELFAVAGLLNSQPSLRRALTDPSAGPEARRNLASRVLEGRVSPPTIDAVAAAVTARWSSAGDLVVALEQLGVLAVVIDADKAAALNDLEDQLFRFSRVVAGNTRLRDAITNKQAPLALRQQLVSGLLEGKASPAAAALAVQAVASRHRSVESALEEYQRVAAEREQRLVGTVRTAVDLTGDELERLGAALARIYGKQIHLNVLVDPAVVGGIRVEIGDDVIDGSVVSRLDDARRRLAG